jgi:hypothetical protein
MRKSSFLAVGVLSLVGALPYAVRPQGSVTRMDTVYADETHCLLAPEIRRSTDHPISCYCRDAIADARYVYFTYILSGKDANLNGTFLALIDRAERQCSLEYGAILEVSETQNWKWSGPEVTRTYPPDNEIERIAPDSKGFRLVKYKVRLTYRDPQGRIARVENLTATELLAPNPKK